MNFFLILMPVTLLASLAAFGGNEVRNGGGGISKLGRSMTFYSANVPVEPQPEFPSDIPGLDYLVQQIKNLNISSAAKSQLFYAVYPLTERQYYKVDATALDEASRAEIIANYTSLYGIPADQLVIFAATDRTKQYTFLFPEFYQLSEIEQATILLHEGTWLLNPEINYKSMVQFEQATQAFFLEPLKFHTYFDFYNKLSLAMGPTNPDGKAYIRAALIYDRNQAQQSNRYVVPVKNIFGDDFVNCVFESATAKSCLPGLTIFLSSRVSPLKDFFMFDLALLQYLKTDAKIEVTPRVNLSLIKNSKSLNLSWREEDTSTIIFDLISPDGEVFAEMKIR